MANDWRWDDREEVPSESAILRKVPKALVAAAKLDPSSGIKVVPPSAFQYDYQDHPEHGDSTQEGVSCHVEPIVEIHEREAGNLYGPEDSVVRFVAGAVRYAGGGLSMHDDPAEPDEVRRVSHALIRMEARLERPPKGKKHPLWHILRGELIQHTEWAHLNEEPIIDEAADQSA